MRDILTYIFPGKLGNSEGVDLKIIGQTKALATKYDAKISSLVLYHNNSLKSLKIMAFGISQIRWIMDCLKSDIVYYRYSAYVPIFNISLLWLSLFRTVWIEYNTVAKYELGLLQWWLPMLHEIQMFILRHSCVHHIAVTREIKELEKLPEDTTIMPNGYYRDQLFVGNQIDLENIIRKIQKEKEKGKKVIVFVGNDKPWHGVERVINFMSKLDQAYLVLIGNIKNYTDLAQMEKQNFVLRLGNINSSNLPVIYELADFGIGSFGLDVNQMKEACPLKVREYLWFGLPVIINYIDPLLNENWSREIIHKVDWDCIDATNEFMCRTYFKNDIIEKARENLKWESVFMQAGLL